MSDIPKFKLNTGASIPAIGFGTWQLEDGSEAKNAIVDALKAGYRLIDTAMIYGNEESVGEAIAESGIARAEIFVTTKLWNSYQGYDQTLHAFDESLQWLGLEYLDLYLIHWPGDSSQKRKDSWRALEKLYEQGKAKAIGVSNYYEPELQELLADSNVVPAVNQIQLHPFVYGERKGTINLCQQKGIVVEAYSPLSRGRQIEHPAISKIAQSLSKTNAQIMLRWAVQHGTVPIPKSAHSGRIKENLAVFDFELSEQDMKTLDSLS